MFFDFSIAFHTIQSILLRGKLKVIKVDPSTTSHIIKYLTERLQFVWLRRFVSEELGSNTAAPQGTVLSPFLFTVCTSDILSDDTTVVECIRSGEETEYRGFADHPMEWFRANHLILNVTKTREMVVDFRRNRTLLKQITIQGEKV